jgi:hypothetical protein
MSLRKLAWAIPVVLGLLALVPSSLAAPPLHVAAATHTVKLPAPVWGTVTNCTSTVACAYVFNTSTGTGWAKSTATSFTPKQMALQLPGEAKASSGLSYATFIQKLTGTYTYWTVGNFLGTDVNTGNVVYGTTNTNYTITCHGHSGRGGGCNYTYATDNGTIVVKFTHQELTSTTIACSPSTIHIGQKSTCTITVSNAWNSSKVPTGTVRVTDGQLGALSNKGVCTLTNGSCSVTFRPFDNTCGNVLISASYVGSFAFYKSATWTTIGVSVAGGC